MSASRPSDLSSSPSSRRGPCIGSVRQPVLPFRPVWISPIPGSVTRARNLSGCSWNSSNLPSICIAGIENVPEACCVLSASYASAPPVASMYFFSTSSALGSFASGGCAVWACAGWRVDSWATTGSVRPASITAAPAISAEMPLSGRRRFVISADIFCPRWGNGIVFCFNGRRLFSFGGGFGGGAGRRGGAAGNPTRGGSQHRVISREQRLPIVWHRLVRQDPATLQSLVPGRFIVCEDEQEPVAVGQPGHLGRQRLARRGHPEDPGPPDRLKPA